EFGAADRVLNELFQQALRVGKRAHAETDIDRVGRSIIGVGLELLDHSLTGASALVIGAGSMSGLAAATLRRAGVSRLVIANRTYARAQRLAEQTDGVAVGVGGGRSERNTADLVITCTGAPDRLLPAAQVEPALANRDGRPLAILDLALPRDT